MLEDLALSKGRVFRVLVCRTDSFDGVLKLDFGDGSLGDGDGSQSHGDRGGFGGGSFSDDGCTWGNCGRRCGDGGVLGGSGDHRDQWA